MVQTLLLERPDAKPIGARKDGHEDELPQVERWQKVKYDDLREDCRDWR